MKCILCGDGGDKHLCKSSEQKYQTLCSQSIKLEDTELCHKLEDAWAKGCLFYHTDCCTDLYNKVKTASRAAKRVGEFKLQY